MVATMSPFRQHHNFTPQPNQLSRFLVSVVRDQVNHPLSLSLSLSRSCKWQFQAMIWTMNECLFVFLLCALCASRVNTTNESTRSTEMASYI